jgi:hypothetical protein
MRGEVFMDGNKKKVLVNDRMQMNLVNLSSNCEVGIHG